MEFDSIVALSDSFCDQLIVRPPFAPCCRQRELTPGPRFAGDSGIGLVRLEQLHCRLATQVVDQRRQVFKAPF